MNFIHSTHRSLLIAMLSVVAGCASMPHPECTPDELTPWKLSYAVMLRKQIRYPREAITKVQSGIVEIAFSVSEVSSFPDVVLRKSSGFAVLDEEAVRAAKAIRLDAPICGGRKSAVTITMPVVFKIASD